MGSCFSGDKTDQSDSQHYGKKYGTDQQKQTLSAMSSFNSSKGVGLGISMMMYQAGMLAGCAAPSSMGGGDLGSLRDQIRKAKAEGRTVTVMNGCVYIDYQLKAQIPPGFNLES
ncbi:hypothetical protein niasHS_012549 [Heterodera schachtii]|uniref:Uncharacterized protein n=2 Tax=Heterodera TaxID=34509 RepID=A0ABD2I5J2_HETSC